MRTFFFLPALIALCLCAGTVYASTPVQATLAFSSLSSGSVQVRVTGAPRVEVLLSYTDQNGNTQSADLGQTDSEGYLTNTLARSDYDVSSGSSVYVSVGGTNSSSVRWPSTVVANSTFTLAQDAPVLTVGQTVIIPAYDAGATPLAVSSNTNSSVAQVSVQGTQVVVSGRAAGSTSASICYATGTGHCQNLTITVGGGSGTGSFYFSNTTPTLLTGTSTQVVMGGQSGAFFISKNTDPRIVAANFQNNLLTLYGNATGTATLTICLPAGSCAMLPVTVISGSSRTPSPILSTDNTNVYVGQSKQVAVAGTSTYHVEKNNHTDVVQATLVGSTITLIGKVVGGATLTICDPTSTYCNYLSVQVAPVPVVVIPPVVATTTPATATFSFTQYLTSGMDGTQVLALQKVLVALGFLKATPNGHFGPATLAAVKKFQSAHKLSALGVVGPGTRAALNASLQPASH